MSAHVQLPSIDVGAQWNAHAWTDNSGTDHAATHLGQLAVVVDSVDEALRIADEMQDLATTLRRHQLARMRADATAPARSAS